MIQSSYDSYQSLWFTATDDVNEDDEIIRIIPDMQSDHYVYMHKWFIDLIHLNPEHKKVLGGVLESFYMSFSPLEFDCPFTNEENGVMIEDHISSIIDKV
jgi:hypothetical protein